MKQIFSYFDQQRERHLAELTRFLSIPSVSTREEHRPDVERAAKWTAEQLESAGLQDVMLHRTDGHPLVTARTPPVPGAPTVLVYGHYDVQPPEPLELWQSPPFVPQVRGGKIFARGAADDKGQVFIYLKVLEAFFAVADGVPINVKLLLEGEEEIGSPNLVPFLKQHRAQLACDLVLVSDTHMMGLRTPSITTGLRGICCLEISVKAAKGDLHSGTFGGAVANPLQVLSQLLASCKDAKTGKVKIPGFYDDVRKLSAGERKALAQLPHDEKAFLRSTGAPALFGERGFTTIERIGARPTFEINGMWGGYIGSGFKTVLPSEAQAKVSMRLVPDQQPRRIAAAAKAFLEAGAPPHVRIKVKRDANEGQPSWVDPEFPAMRTAASAVEKVFGKAPVYSLEGGSIPIVADFKRVLGRDTILLGFGLPDDNLHAPNEKFDLRMLERGMKTVTHFFEDLARG